MIASKRVPLRIDFLVGVRVIPLLQVEPDTRGIIELYGLLGLLAIITKN